MKIVCLVSGGLDSSVMLYMLKKDGNDLFPIYIDYGHKSSKMEINSFIKVCRFLKIKPLIIKFSDFAKISLSGLTNTKISPIQFSFVPGRNLLFLTIATAYAHLKGAKIIAIGLLKNPVFSDQTKKFVIGAEQIISLSIGYKIKILAPFMKLDKREIIELAKKHKFPLRLTYSCHFGSTRMCGKCTACKERIAAEQYSH